MRTLPLLSVACLFAACQSAPTGSAGTTTPRNTGFVDANYSRGPVPLESRTVAPDPVVAQVLRGAMHAFETRRRVAIENLANVGTPAYRKRTVLTSVQTVAGPDGESFSVPVVIGTSRDFTQGALEYTGRNLDIAIDGEGFFAVVLPDGSIGYRRDASLCINADGKIVFAGNEARFSPRESNVLIPEITIPNDTLELSIDPEGRFTGRTAGSPDTATRFGQITIHRFVNPDGMRCADSIYRPTESSGQPITGTPGRTGIGLLKQGFRELSNVDAAKAMMELQQLEQQHQWLVRVLHQFGMGAL